MLHPGPPWVEKSCHRQAPASLPALQGSPPGATRELAEAGKVCPMPDGRFTQCWAQPGRAAREELCGPGTHSTVGRVPSPTTGSLPESEVGPPEPDGGSRAVRGERVTKPGWGGRKRQRRRVHWPPEGPYWPRLGREQPGSELRAGHSEVCGADPSKSGSWVPPGTTPHARPSASHLKCRSYGLQQRTPRLGCPPGRGVTFTLRW